MIGAAQAAPYIVGVLGVGGIAVWASGKRELVRRWRSWVMIAPVVGCAHYLGAPGIAVLAAALALVAMVEFGRTARLGRPETIVAAVVTAAAPITAWLAADFLWRLLLLGAVAVVLVPVLAGDEHDGARQAAFSVYGTAWLAGLSGLVLLGPAAFALCVAVAVADVGAWCGGRLLGGPPLSPLSPAKRWGGVLGGAAAGLTVLALFGALTPALAIAVVVAAPLGDLLESMIKRGAGAKDTGGWLPGMGGLLDRIDSLLLALPVAVVLS
ncbi:hypothetical protein GCM10009799_30840 [Nocardiopsis rhodophaea]|uniref:Phosphatidate cytidylyltransferase n=1 Tax=Nocardiopsis rhodophaea TaxID=280238 RepID=A0ABN2T898_9ACTN